MADASRNLIVLSDGTGNSASNPFKTNVWRLYQALQLVDGSQIALFGDGVGTSSNKILRVIGLALGFGVKRNVLDLYKFLCRNYNEGDRIWAFGFSRGAFTIRVLVGLIYREGLVSFASEAELDRNALAAYRSYRMKAFWTIIPWVMVGRFLRDRLQSLWNVITGARSYKDIAAETKRVKRDPIPVHFVGVWDTVVAYGLPIDELTQAVDKWVWPMKFRDDRLLPHVRNGRHALSLDDERRTFHPIPWNETTEQERTDKHEVPEGRLRQVWFAGMHADVGGGYPDDGLSYVPLCWMIDEATAKGLRFESASVSQYRAMAASTGRMYDSRAGSGALWRYQPRSAQLLMKDDNVPVIHNSVVTRMIWGDDGYAPISLPEEIKILPAHGSPLSFDATAIKDALERVEKDLRDTSAALQQATAANTSASPIERRPLEERRQLLEDERRSLQHAQQLVTLTTSQHKRTDLFQLVQDIVWWRRVVYFVTLAFAVTAVAYPLLAQYLRIEGVTDHFNDLTDGPVRSTLLSIKGLLPGIAEPWLTAVIRNTAGAALIVIGLTASLGLSKMLQRRICDRARAAWNVRSRVDGIKFDRLAPSGQRHALARVTLILAAFAAAAYAFPDEQWLFYILGATAVVFGLWWAFRRVKRAESADPASPNVALRLARTARTSPIALGTYRFVAQKLGPAAFLLLSCVLVGSIVHRAAFDLMSSRGEYCEATKEVKDLSRDYAQAQKKGPQSGQAAVEGIQLERLGPGLEFQLSTMCHATGLQLVAGRQYRIRLDIDQDLNKEWFDKGRRTDVVGFAADTWLHIAAAPLKRWWRENWFQPIARIGEKGNNEHALRPAAPLPILRSSTNCPAAENERQEAWHHDIESAASDTFKRAQIGCDGDHGIQSSRVLISDITADATGELFLYVNDAIVLWPRRTDMFYRNNSGSAKVTATRILATAIEPQ
jgi:uncharacterized protein (DUF2235 family)